MATHETERRNAGGGIGIGLGGILVIAGIVIALAWSVLIGIIVAVVGLVALAALRRESGTSGASRPEIGAVARRRSPIFALMFVPQLTCD